MNEKKSIEVGNIGEGYPGEPSLFKERGAKKRKGNLFFLLILLFLPLIFFSRAHLIRGEAVIRAHEFIELGPTTEGILREMVSRTGDTVEKGKLVAHFENPGLSEGLAQANLRLEILAHEFKRLLNRKKFLGKEKQAKTILFEIGAVAKRVLETVDFELNQTLEEIAIKEKEIEAQKAQTRFLKERLASLDLEAPFRGVVIRDQAQKTGNLIKEGEPVIELCDPASFYLEFSVREQEAEKLKVGDRVRIRFHAIPGRSYRGRINRIDRKTVEEVEKVFKVKHVVLCEIQLDEIPENARYGMRASVKIDPQRVRHTPAFRFKITDFFMKKVRGVNGNRNYRL